MTDEDRWITTDNRSGRLVLRFRVKGYQKQFFIATGLSDTKRSRELVRMKRDRILTDVALDQFDYTLENYRFRPSQAKVVEEPKKAYGYNILELWNRFTDYQETQVEQTTILNRYAAILRYTRKLPTFSLEESPLIRDWLSQNTTKLMAWLVISHYIQCCDWAVNSQLIPDNPFAKFKAKKPQRNNGDYQAFTLGQRDLIIEAFENHQRFSYLTSLIKFLFWTGCRHGEAFALLWDDISASGCEIRINKSCNLYNILKSTKTGKSRFFTTSKGSKLQLMLTAMRPMKVSPGQLVFTTLNGNPLKSSILQRAWKGGKQFGDVIYDYPGVVQELVDQGRLPYYLKSYATRHTFATWAITQGVSPDKVARWIGDGVQTVLEYYCHPEVVKAECPDF